MQIVWDEAKRQLNLAKHGLDFADIPPGSFRTATILPAHSDRRRAIGSLDDRLLVAVVYRPTGSEAVSIVSFRRASIEERRRHDRP